MFLIEVIENLCSVSSGVKIGHPWRSAPFWGFVIAGIRYVGGRVCTLRGVSLGISSFYQFCPIFLESHLTRCTLFKKLSQICKK